MKWKDFDALYPLHIYQDENGKNLPYRYYKHSDSDKTVVLLTGAIGLSDAMENVFSSLAHTFSVITMNYSIHYPNADAFLASLSQLLDSLHLKAWIAGQSLGGLLAQTFAARYPKQTQGLICINTGSLEKGMSEKSYHDMMTLIHEARAVKIILPILPYQLFRNILIRQLLKKANVMEPEPREIMEDFADIIQNQLSKSYAAHMVDFLISTKDLYGLSGQDFSCLENRILLMFSQDDQTFSRACRSSLIHMLPAAKVMEDFQGGHMSLFLKPEQFAGIMASFIIREEPEKED